MKVKPISIKYITDRKGRVLEANEPEIEQAISPQTAFLITSMMEDVVKYGTGWRAKSLGVPVAGKTGTTNDYRDAWFVGYTSNLVASVWVGFDNSRPLGALETGARALRRFAAIGLVVIVRCRLRLGDLGVGSFRTCMPRAGRRFVHLDLCMRACG